MNRTDLESRSIIDDITGCWIYMGIHGKGTNSYPRTRERKNYDGTIFIHRWSYENYIGPIPDGMDILHSCHDGRCVNPYHLRPGSHQDNMDDKVDAGRQHHPVGENNVKAKLTEDQVRAILADPRKPCVIAREYGVTETTIHDIRRRDTWQHIDGEAVKHLRHPNEKLTPEQAAAVRNDTRSYAKIAAQYGISKQTVCNTKKGVSYRD